MVHIILVILIKAKSKITPHRLKKKCFLGGGTVNRFDKHTETFQPEIPE